VVAAVPAAAGKPAAGDPRELVLAVRDACRAALAEAHEEALLAGLCGDGAWEAALGALSRLSADELLQRAAARTSGR
jgi:hypothetical protein